MAFLLLRFRGVYYYAIQKECCNNNWNLILKDWKGMFKVDAVQVLVQRLNFTRLYVIYKKNLYAFML
jgi:hypothetical protein